MKGIVIFALVVVCIMVGYRAYHDGYAQARRDGACGCACKCPGTKGTKDNHCACRKGCCK